MPDAPYPQSGSPSTDVKLRLREEHDRLADRFRGLQAARKDAARAIFAIEHGLHGQPLEELKSLVRRQISQRIAVGDDNWLPLVVYATEFGYAYTGVEYWQSFEEHTPGWRDGYRNDIVRATLRRFATEFGGAIPKGPWAETFRIICWPITHALLPQDLQEQLAQLLGRSRYTVAMLDDPDLLGKHLAHLGGGHGSSRWEGLLENWQFLGQVAAALLHGSEAPEELISADTLERIVADLSATSRSKRWLQQARSRAGLARIHGLSRRARHSESRDSEEEGIAPETAEAIGVEPRLTLSPVAQDVWRLHLTIPPLAQLAELVPELYATLSSARLTLNGLTSRPLPTRALLVGYDARLEQWPNPQKPIVSGVKQDDLLDFLLTGDWLALRSPVQVFKLGRDGVARCIRGRTVRPGCSYLLTRAAGRAGPPLIGQAVTVDCGEVIATQLTIPRTLTTELVSGLNILDLEVGSDLFVSPCGAPAIEWDGEGHGRWVVGEEPMIAIHHSEEAAILTVVIDGDMDNAFTDVVDAALVPVSLGSLSEGVHEVVISVDADDPARRPTEGTLIVTMVSLAMAGESSEIMTLLPDPSSPGMDELWEGRATLDLLGPPGVPVTTKIELVDRSRGMTKTRVLDPVPLPIRKEAWPEIATRCVQRAGWDRDYENATRCVITFAAPGAGAAQLTAQRALQPLRWSYERAGRNARLALRNDSGSSSTISILLYPPATPAQPIEVAITADPYQEFEPLDGLMVASSPDLSVGIVCHKPVRAMSLEDLQHVRVYPVIRPPVRTVSALQNLTLIAQRWRDASFNADALAATTRRDALTALIETLCSVIGGRRLAEAEHANKMEGVPLERFEAAVKAKPPRGVDLSVLFAPETHDVIRGCRTFDHKVELVSDLLFAPSDAARSDSSPSRLLTEAALRMASDPGSLPVWAGATLDHRLYALLEAPDVMRAARYLVLATQEGASGLASVYGGWSWQ